MDDRRRRSPSDSLPAVIGLALLLLPVAARAGDASPFPARQGLELASAAAQSWSRDAVLVYVENDEPLAASGASSRWGYLFYSPGEDRARVWSVRGGRIALAENLDMRFDAPPVASGWVDSGAALAAAEKAAGEAFRKESRGRLETMLLMRGAFS